jgi:hypothetical protein
METKNVHKPSISEDENKHEFWFGEFLTAITNQIKVDKSNLETGDATPETVAFYGNLIAGNNIELWSDARKSMSKGIAQQMVVSYFKLLSERKINFIKLALDLSLNKILVWAEINDNDEVAEMALIRVESIINATYAQQTGIELDSIIVEKSDNLPIPPHYQIVELQ